MPYPLPLTRTEAYLAYKAGVIQQSDLKPSLAVPRNGIDAWLAYWTGIAEDYPKREDGTPHILQEEEAYIAYLCGVLDEYPEKCLRRVGAYLRYIISARWGRPDHPLNREELYLSLIETQFIPSGDPSSDIVIDGTAKAPFVDVKMYGDTFQQSYDGKNLFDFDSWAENSTTRSGVTWTANTDQSVTSEGTSTTTHSGCFFEFRESGDNEDTKLEAGTYYIKAISSNPNIGVYGLYRKSGSTTTLALFSPTASGSTASFTIPDNEQYQRMCFRVVAMGSGLDCSGTTRVILSKDQNFVDAGVFEPFVGGTPSPNPEYPQPIQTVTGLQTVEIVGKNLFDGITTHQLILSDGTISNNGNWNLGGFIKVEPNTTYTVSFELGSGGSHSILISEFDSNKDFLARAGSQSLTPYTFTTSSTTEYIRLNYNNTNNDTDFQIELGSSASDYIPYSKQTLPLDLGNIELNNLEDTYLDYIWKDGSDWKIRKNTNRFTFETRKLMGLSKQPLGFAYNTDNNPLEGKHIPLVGECSHFDVESTTTTWTALNKTGMNSGGALWFRTAESSQGDTRTIEEFGQWLVDAGVSFVYALETPTDTVITNQALIDQLNALKRGGAEEGTTYIKVSATDPNLPAKLYVEAPKYE